MNKSQNAMPRDQNPNRHLILNTFGRVTLEYRGLTIANSTIPTTFAIADFMFRVHINPDASIDIQRNPQNLEYRLQIVIHGHRAATLKMGSDGVEVDVNHASDMISVVQRPLRKVVVDRKNEEDSKLDTLVLILDENQPLWRIDYRYNRGPWVSVFINQTYVLTVRPNGDYFALAANISQVNSDSKSESSSPSVFDLQVEFLKNKSVLIFGFVPESHLLLEERCKVAVADIIVDINYKETVDFLILPVDIGSMYGICFKAKHIVNALWLVSCFSGLFFENLN